MRMFSSEEGGLSRACVAAKDIIRRCILFYIWHVTFATIRLKLKLDGLTNTCGHDGVQRVLCQISLDIVQTVVCILCAFLRVSTIYCTGYMIICSCFTFSGGPVILDESSARSGLVMFFYSCFCSFKSIMHHTVNFSQHPLFEHLNSVMLWRKARRKVFHHVFSPFFRVVVMQEQTARLSLSVLC